MATERKTLITIFESNGSFEFEADVEGFGGKDVLQLIGFLDYVKADFLNTVDEFSETKERE